MLLPLIFGTVAAVVFHQKFAGRGFLRGVFIMPMMATPGDRAGLDHDVPPAARRVELSAVVGRPAAAALGVSPATVILAGAGRDPQWTPLVMLIVLGGLPRSRPAIRKRAIDGANFWQMFRYITLPLITPFLFIAGDPMIDAVKSFDITAITQEAPARRRRPSTLSHSVAFIYYDLGYGSAIAVVFFALIVALAAVLLYLRQRMLWTEIGRVSMRQVLERIGLWLAVSVIVSPAILFFLWMASLSLKFEVDNAAYPPVFIPRALCLKNYADVVASNRFLTYFINSLVVTGSATFGDAGRCPRRLRHRGWRRTSPRS